MTELGCTKENPKHASSVLSRNTCYYSSIGKQAIGVLNLGGISQFLGKPPLGRLVLSIYVND
jgi:hypothetical protein